MIKLLNISVGPKIYNNCINVDDKIYYGLSKGKDKDHGDEIVMITDGQITANYLFDYYSNINQILHHKINGKNVIIAVGSYLVEDNDQGCIFILDERLNISKVHIFCKPSMFFKAVVSDDNLFVVGLADNFTNDGSVYFKGMINHYKIGEVLIDLVKSEVSDVAHSNFRSITMMENGDLAVCGSSVIDINCIDTAVTVYSQDLVVKFKTDYGDKDWFSDITSDGNNVYLVGTRTINHEKCALIVKMDMTSSNISHEELCMEKVSSEFSRVCIHNGLIVSSGSNATHDMMVTFDHNLEFKTMSLFNRANTIIIKGISDKGIVDKCLSN